MPRQIKKSILQTIILVLFFFIGLIFASPCLCAIGAAKSPVKLILFAIVFARLIVGTARQNMTIWDYVFWIGSFFVFCMVVEIL